MAALKRAKGKGQLSTSVPKRGSPTRDLAESIQSAVFGAVKNSLAPVLQSLHPGPQRISEGVRIGSDSRKRRYFLVHIMYTIRIYVRGAFIIDFK